MQVAMREANELPKKVKIERLYTSYTPVFNEVLSKIEDKLKAHIRLQSMPTYKARIKSFPSYYKKILRQKPKESSQTDKLVTLTDMLGLRIICAFMEDTENVVTQLSSFLTVREIEHKGFGQSFREFGYESVHVLIDIPEDCRPTEHLTPVLPEDMVFEIQVRTILQDAWAEVEHELIYKTDFNPFDKPLRRKLAAINANLNLADTIFQEIRDYQNKLQAELGIRRNTFYDKADRITDDELGIESSAERASLYAAEPSIYEKGSIDDLVLSALHEHNLGNFDHAISIYTQILDKKDVLQGTMMSVILKHRGMAHFAQNEYDKAIEDFKQSESYDSKAFRSIYYQGIVYEVLKKYDDAIDCFNRSLAIDPFQSHVYYRRSVSYFENGKYEEAMSDINKAFELGLDNDDTRQLRSQILKKFDMGM